jgi:hypothetical protein
MWQNRRGAFAKRFAKPPPPEVGVVFPPDGKGGRTTTATSQAAIAAALRGCGGDEAAAAAAAAGRDRGWKFSYPRHYLNLVRLGAGSAHAARESAQAGLDWCYANFQFVPAPGAPAEPVGGKLGGRELGAVRVEFEGVQVAARAHRTRERVRERARARACLDAHAAWLQLKLQHNHRDVGDVEDLRAVRQRRRP